MKSYYTLCLDIEDKKCVIVGGGAVARRKAAAMKDHGACITVISPKLESVLEYMAFQKDIEWISRDFQPQDIEGAFLVVAATNSRETNHQVSVLCHENQILCNIADAPQESTFISPSTIERGPLTIAISTNGINPTLSASIRQELEIAYGEEYGTFLEIVSTLRPRILEEFPSPQIRAHIFERMVSSRALTLIRSGMMDEARKELEDIVYTARTLPTGK
jgi:precorrin-2 dehydrogenase/sirohydrochlorin ferrochelatase